MNNKIYIGIDGGGTRTTALAVSFDENGECIRLGKGVGAGSNFASDTPERAAQNVMCAIKEAMKDSGNIVEAIGMGNASLDDFTYMPGTDEFIAMIENDPFFETKPRVFCKSDAFTALYALTDGKPGALLISGTGVMGMACDADGKLYPVSGWGDRLGDEGSGFYIALEGLKAALRYADGGKKTLLYDAMLKHYSIDDPRKILDIIYADDYDKSVLASFSKCVSDTAELGDEKAMEILDSAAEILASLAHRLCELSGSDIFGMYGSIFKNDKVIREKFKDIMSVTDPTVKISFPSVSAEEAAARYAWRQCAPERK